MAESAGEIAHTASELHIVLGQILRRLRAENTLPISHSTVLSRLSREGVMTTSSLAAAERVRQQSMAETVVDLTKGGLVQRRRDPDDRRQLLIELTEHGRATLADDRERRDGWLFRALSDGLTKREQRVLAEAIGLLRRLAESQTV